MKDERGFALIETILVGLLLLVPLVWLLGFLSDLHRGALASAAAAKEAGAEAARRAGVGDMDAAVERAVALAFKDHGLDPRRAEVRVRSAGGRGAPVEVVVGYDVTVLQAPFLGKVAGPSIEVTARHIARIDPYASRR
jgi:hypothetical protein